MITLIEKYFHIIDLTKARTSQDLLNRRTFSCCALFSFHVRYFSIEKQGLVINIAMKEITLSFLGIYGNDLSKTLYASELRKSRMASRLFSDLYSTGKIIYNRSC